MPDKDAVEIAMGRGAVTSSKIPGFHLIPTEALMRLAARFDFGAARKQEQTWNATTSNQAALLDREFILHRIGHVVAHALKLRDKIIKGGAFMDEQDDDAGAIIWAGAFLCCVTKAIRDANEIRDREQDGHNSYESDQRLRQVAYGDERVVNGETQFFGVNGNWNKK